MKPTQQEQRNLKDYLYKAMEYYETCEEVYDHILTALELNEYQDMSFSDAVNRIVKEDFKGQAGLAIIETRYQRETMGEMKRRYWNYLLNCLKFPLIGVVAICSLMIYFLIKQPGFNLYILGVMIVLMMFVPPVLNSVRYIKTGYVLGYTKRSVKDAGFRQLTSIPCILILFLMVQFYHVKYSPLNLIKTLNPEIITLIFMVYVLHSISFYKVHSQEFKINISDQ